MVRRNYRIVLAAGLVLLVLVPVVGSIIDTSATSDEGNEQLYSTDGGATWLSKGTLDNGDLKNIEFWRYEDYQAWVEEQNEFLDSLVGSGARYKANGEWRTWTAEEVKQTKEIYQDNLKRIKEGYQLAKVFDEEDPELIIHPLDEPDTSQVSDSDSFS